MEVLATDMAKGPLMLRPSLRPTPGSDMVVSTATEVLAMDMERGLLMLRPNLRLMPGSDMVDSTATVLVWAMAAMAMEVLATDTERGPLRPSLRPMPGTDTDEEKGFPGELFRVTEVVSVHHATGKLFNSREWGDIREGIVTRSDDNVGEALSG